MKYEKINSLLKKKRGHAVEYFLFVVLFLGSFLSMGATIYSQFLQERYDRYYGSWEAVVYGADASLYEVLQNHTAVDRIGRMDVCGYALDSALDVCGSLGYVNQALIEMEYVELESGRFPEKDNEIAVQASVLSKLGYEKKLGQEIVLDVTETVKNGKADAENSRISTKKYYVSGIINNYSAYWQDDGEWPVSIFIRNNPDGDLPISKTHLYISVKSEYSRYLNALKAICSNRGRWQINGYRQNGTSSAVSMYTVCYRVYHLFLYGFLILAGVTFFFYLLGCELWKNKEIYRCLFFLGLGKKAFFQLYFQNKWKKILQFGFAGFLAGSAASLLFHVFIQTFKETELSNLFNVKTFLLNLSIVLGGALILVIIIVLLDFHMLWFDFGEERKGHGMDPKKQPMSLPRFFRSLFGMQRRTSRFLLCGISLVMLLCSNASWMYYRDYQYYLNSYPYDYIFDRFMNYRSDPYAISQKELSEISSIKGITDIHCFSKSEYEDVFCGNRNLSFYENYSDQNGNSLERGVLASRVEKTIVSVSDEYWNQFQNDMELDEELYRAGGVILYVPDLYLLPSGQMMVDLWMQYDFFNRNTYIQKYQENTIKPGDTIRVNPANGEANLKVAGVLRGLKENAPTFMLTMAPYSIICREEVYKKLFGEEIFYSCVIFNIDDDNSFQTDLELDKTSAGHRFKNYRSQRKKNAAESILCLVLCVCLIEFVVFLSFLVGWKGKERRRKQVWDRILQIHILGMTLSEIKREVEGRRQLNIFISIFLADVLFLVIQGITNLVKYGKSFDNSMKLYENVWNFVWSKFVYNINFLLLIEVSLFLFCLYSLLHHLEVCHMLKKITKMYD